MFAPGGQRRPNQWKSSARKALWLLPILGCIFGTIIFLGAYFVPDNVTHQIAGVLFGLGVTIVPFIFVTAIDNMLKD